MLANYLLLSRNMLQTVILQNFFYIREKKLLNKLLTHIFTYYLHIIYVLLVTVQMINFPFASLCI